MSQFLQYDLRDTLSNPSLCPGLGHSFTPDPRTHVIGRGLRRLAGTFYPHMKCLDTSLATPYLSGHLSTLPSDLGKEFCVSSEKMGQEGRSWQKSRPEVIQRQQQPVVAVSPASSCSCLNVSPLLISWLWVVPAPTQTGKLCVTIMLYVHAKA